MSENDLMLNLGRRIKTIRLTKNLTQNQLAMQCRFEKAGMSRIEAGLSNPTVKTLHKISNALDVPIADFFKD